MWIHSNANTHFTFLDKLLSGIGITELFDEFTNKDWNNSQQRIRSQHTNFLYENLDDENEKVSFFKYRSKKYTEVCFVDIEEYINEDKSSKEQKFRVNETIAKIDFYINKLSSYNPIYEHYYFFIDDLTSLKENVLLKYSYALDPIIGNIEPAVTKITWNGGVTSLAALFRKLLTDKRLSGNKTYIDSSQAEEVIKMIIERFSDKGEPFNTDSLRRGIKSNKPAKRNDINLDDFLP